MFLDSTRVNLAAKGDSSGGLSSRKFQHLCLRRFQDGISDKVTCVQYLYPDQLPLVVELRRNVLRLSSTLPASGSSEMAMCRTSSFSKYSIRALLISEPPSLQSEVYLLSRGDMDSHWSCLLPLTLVGYQNQCFVVTSNHDGTLCSKVIVPLCGMSHNVFNFVKVEATKTCIDALSIYANIQAHPLVPDAERRRVTVRCSALLCVFVSSVNILFSSIKS